MTTKETKNAAGSGTKTITDSEMHYIHIEGEVHHVFRVDEKDHTTKHIFDANRDELPEHLQKGLAFLLLLPDESEGDKIGARLASDFFLVL